MTNELRAVPPAPTTIYSPTLTVASESVPLAAEITSVPEKTTTLAETTWPPALLAPLAEPPGKTISIPPPSTVVPSAAPPDDTTS